MKRTIFEGCATASVTPFSGGRPDLVALGGILEEQIACGTAAVVLCGTTGEAPTLTESEFCDIVSFGTSEVSHRVPVIVGCGSPDTASAVKKAKKAEALGADALLCVTPFYNKGTKNGVTAHFKAVAAAADLPVILYNVPSRTGVDIPLSVYDALTKTENILAVKEASGDVRKAADLLTAFGDRYDVYSGADEVNLPILALGGKGVISVLSNVVPKEVAHLCALVSQEKLKEAAALNVKLAPLAKALFCETNPAPVKAALAALGKIKNELRLPLTPVTDPSAEALTAVMHKLELL